MFALFVAATTFTLVFRAFDSDRLLAALVAAIPGGGSGAVAAVLLVLGLCAFVLDAFEIILVIIPLLMPALLMREPDAVWVVRADAAGPAGELPHAALRLCRDDGAQRDGGDRAAASAHRGAAAVPRALQLLVLGLTLAYPPLTHLAEPATIRPQLSPMRKSTGSSRISRRCRTRMTRTRA